MNENAEASAKAFRDGEYGVSLNLDIDRIMDVFAGVDGGVDFVKFKLAMEDIASRAGTEDPSFQLVRVVRQFTNLVDAVTNYKPKETA